MAHEMHVGLNVHVTTLHQHDYLDQRMPIKTNHILVYHDIYKYKIYNPKWIYLLIKDLAFKLWILFIKWLISTLFSSVCGWMNRKRRSYAFNFFMLFFTIRKGFSEAVMSSSHTRTSKSIFIAFCSDGVVWTIEDLPQLVPYNKNVENISEMKSIDSQYIHNKKTYFSYLICTITMRYTWFLEDGVVISITI